MRIEIVSFSKDSHENEVVQLWETVFGYGQPRNDAKLAIEKKIQVADDLFFVAEKNSKVCGTVMCGYDGHRGWIYSLAVLPEYQSRGVGKQLMIHAESVLGKLGCMKINLQIIEGNYEVQDFYLSLGYSAEERISMGKELAGNIAEKDE